MFNDEFSLRLEEPDNIMSTPVPTVKQVSTDQVEREILTRERAILAKERELLNRERDLLERERTMMQTSMNGSMALRVPVELTDNLLPEYDPAKMTGLTASQWIQRVESVANAYGWDASFKLLQAVGKLRGAAKLWFEGIAEEVATWTTFRHHLIRSFPSTFDQADVHYHLAQRKKERSETYEQYVYAMRALANRGEVEMSSLFKYILGGFSDKELIKLLSLMEFNNCEELLLKIKRYESVNDRKNFSHQLLL